jgi:nucleotide-binding universal stress UspA family protein
MKFKRIVVPVDLSSSSLQALEFAADLAKPFDAELIALFVIEPVLYVVPDYSGAQSSALAELASDQRRLGRAELARIERRYARRRVRLRGEILNGLPAAVIVDAAKRAKADLIVMATHGRTGVSRLLMGSVAERVVRTATCPVLTLHPAAAPATRRRSARKAAEAK